MRFERTEQSNFKFAITASRVMLRQLFGLLRSPRLTLEEL